MSPAIATAALEPIHPFELAEDRAASSPPESRGVPRDGVRLMVADRDGARHARFRHLPRFLRRGDLLVVNTSATLAAAVDATRGDGERVAVHVSTRLDDGDVAVEPRPAGRATGPLRDARPGATLTLPDGSRLELHEPWPNPSTTRPRLWRARPSAGADLDETLRRHGRPIAYAYTRGRWPLSAYQTIFALHPGSAEMPSAGRPFTRRVLLSLSRAGIGIATVTLHAGVSSLEIGEPPLPERFVVPAAAASRVERVRRAGGRIVAVGTTVTRALESAVTPDGRVVPRAGWTDLVLSAERPARVVDGIVTGWHAPGASHLGLLAAVAGRRTVRRAYGAALRGAYLWHEFGDSCLLLRAPRDAAAAGV